MTYIYDRSLKYNMWKKIVFVFLYGLQMSNAFRSIFDYSQENQAKIDRILHDRRYFKNYPEFEIRLRKCASVPKVRNICAGFQKEFVDQINNIADGHRDEKNQQIELEKAKGLYKKIDYTLMGMDLNTKMNI